MNNPTFVLIDGDSRNTHGFRIALKGLLLERFNANPVMLYQHDRSSVVGRWENVLVADNRLTADAVFDVEDEQGKVVAGKVQRGFLKGASVGIIVKKLTDSGKELVVTEAELMEASIVSVPSDASAVRLYDENRQPVTFEQVRLNFEFNNKNNKNKMEEGLKLSDKTLASLGLTADHTAKDVEQATEKLTAQVAQLTATIEAQQKASVEVYLDAALKSGKLTEVEKQNFAKLAAADFDSVKAIVDARAEKASASLADMAKKTAPTPDGLAKLSWDELDKAGKLAKLKAEYPEVYQQKFDEKFKK
jgi:HK97 family phage prohead protease